MEFDLEIFHRALITYEIVATISRFPTNGLRCTILEDDLPVIAFAGCNKRALSSSRTYTADGPQVDINSTFWNVQSTTVEFLEAKREIFFSATKFADT